MAKTRAIVKRRNAIRNIRKITRTMELIATARFKKAMDRATEADAYTRKIGELVADLSRSGAAAKHPLLEERTETKRSVLLVLTSNRGLCGGYNGNVLRNAVEAYNQSSAAHPVDLEVSGKRGVSYLKYRKLPITKTYTKFEDKPGFEEVEELADRYLAEFLAGRIDRLDVAYTRFFSAGKQAATVQTLLPMSALTTDDSAKKKSAEPDVKGVVDYEFLPSAEDILNEIVPVSFKVRLFKCFLDAAVSEQIARMVAMKGATENAGNLIKTLSSRYNRARQAQITSELAEIIGTAEALK
jgi:F-type H+-transporting ATPase subunit gamma